MANADVKALWSEARAAWPGVDVPLDAFARFVAARATKLDGVHASHLYLACACLRNDRAALDAFDRSFMPDVRAYVARVDRSEPFADEVRQLMREKLFVGDAPKLAEYTGKGALDRWLHVVALRVALNLKRRPKKTVDPEDREASALLATDSDPELDYIKTRYSAAFNAAFKESLAKLTTKQRHILRLHLVDGLNVDKIAALEKVNRSTVARWIQAAREQLGAGTHALLRERLALTPPELESLLGLVRSRIDVSLVGFLRRD